MIRQLNLKQQTLQLPQLKQQYSKYLYGYFMCMSKWDIYILRECFHETHLFHEENITKHGEFNKQRLHNYTRIFIQINKQITYMKIISKKMFSYNISRLCLLETTKEENKSGLFQAISPFAEGHVFLVVSIWFSQAKTWRESQ